ncbi:MAG: UDP-N-acetylmuramate dehydrogenase [Aquimonas sp.]|nr:UDP-N-acetylmuramate dehydrogenase [Aquimonas sp.]
MGLSSPWLEHADLSTLNSFGVPARARWFARCRDTSELQRALQHCPAPPLVLGGGSNLLFAADPDTPVLQPDLRGIRLDALDPHRVQVSVAAGEPWDALVRRCCDWQLWGIENLALIPGTAGAAPVQNIGAYGVELAEHLRWVEAVELRGGASHRLPAAALGFGYRDSRFKREPGEWLITRIGLELRRDGGPRLGYAGLEDALLALGADPRRPTAGQVAEAIRSVRRRKLPDPAQIGNAGSFFKNPEVTSERAAALRNAWPSLPVFPGKAAGFSKLSAAWLIEAAGLKGLRRGDAGVSGQHALVLVNHGAAKGAELLALAREVATAVQVRFGIALEPEPVIIGALFREAS